MQRDRGKALSAGLQGLFGKLAARPAPEHILRVVDQLEAAASGEPAEPSDATPSPAPPSTPAP